MKRAPSQYKIGKEVVLDASKLTQPQIRCLVTNYYNAQKLREAADMQIRHIGMRQDEIALPLQAWGNVQAQLEKDVLKMMEVYAANHPVGKWVLKQHGVGPVIAAGLIAYLDPTYPVKQKSPVLTSKDPQKHPHGSGIYEGTPTVGHWWSLAGLEPNLKWEKGQKRPYNAELKQICYHLGQCIMRTHEEGSLYGQLYKSRKELVVKRNEAGQYKERAKTFFTNSAYVKAILKKGMLPPNNLDSQARNYAVKIFLSHFHALMYWNAYGIAPARPYEIEVLGYEGIIKIPDMDMFPGFEEAYYSITKKPKKAAPKKTNRKVSNAA